MTDRLLVSWVSGLIELKKLQWMLGSGSPWKPGAPLKLLFAGYNGTRNTGSDVRVEETLRQVSRILGDSQVELTVMTQNFDWTRGYFGRAKQVYLPDVFPPFLSREVPRHDGVIACEGSMFKSKFANALTTMMIGALGLASAQNKLSVGYGAEAGAMDPFIAAMCRRYCHDSLILTRNEASRAVLRELDISTELGTDTAWTFEPLAPEYGQKFLREAGWDGKRPVLALCPINPFWWPVQASLAKAAAHAAMGSHCFSHYRTIYFHTWGPRQQAAYEKYLTAFSRGAQRFCNEQGVFPVLIGMERLDADACERVAGNLGGAPVVRSDAFDMYQIVSILRCAHLMVSSRFHGIVTAMPALVPSAGITMDERIRNLMNERGHPHLLLEVDDPDLEERLFVMLRHLVQERESVRAAIGRTVVNNLKAMARMGLYFEEHVRRRLPEFPLRSGLLSWEDYLPPLSPCLEMLVETHGG